MVSGLAHPGSRDFLGRRIRPPAAGEDGSPPRVARSEAVTSASGPATSSPSRRKGGGRSRSEQVRLVLAGLLGGLAVAFALLNTGHVEVDWILGSWSTPLIVVILVSLLAGALLGFTLAKRAGRSATRAPERRG